MTVFKSDFVKMNVLKIFVDKKIFLKYNKSVPLPTKVKGGRYE